ncbi:F-box protein At4g00755-like isoform X1 [Tasmannia lanceolata]|uniref:F-box protein At4g00755-like isoform X1 n=2 Tax=Tasmannia lanceolata TaxID=3420 RepID=UPI004063FF1E
MEGDLLEWLGCDMSIKVLMYLDHPSDIGRVSCLSRSWRQFVIANGFCKKLCIKKFPEAECFTHVTEPSNSMEPVEVGTSNYLEWEILEREHRVYAHLARALTSPVKMKDCIEYSMGASSTDNYPDEGIDNTLDPSDRVGGTPSYWSSKGEEDPEVPEALYYRLTSTLCIVDEIKIQPFQVFFQDGNLIYSAQAVRFKMGHVVDMASNTMNEVMAGQRSVDDAFIWTYVSPKFPMAQKNCLQTFKLPQPVLCIGGVVQIELLGRVQRHELDGLYYICMCHVQVLGRPLSVAFDVHTINFPRKCVLTYSADVKDCSLSSRMASEEECSGTPGGLLGFAARFRQIRQIRAGWIWDRAFQNTWFGNVAGGENSESDDE